MRLSYRCGWIVLLLLISGLIAGCATTTPAAGTGFGTRPDVQAFIQKVSTKDQFNARQLTVLFNQVNPRPAIVHHAQKPTETGVSWPKYRAIFLNREKIEGGVAFWKAHVAILNKAYAQYGVEPQIVVAIIGVETDDGKYMGKYRVIDSLSTLAFNYPRRAGYFQNELEQYLLLTRELNIDPLSLYGSYAGAVGYCQFMPSSYRKLAVSCNPGKSPDLWHNPEDAILSVADYFYANGWKSNQPVAVRIRQSMPGGIAFGQEYWLLYPNFKVIKRYNNSNFYAMAVYQLGEAIRREKANE